VLTDAGYAFPLVSSIYKRLYWANKIEEFIIVGISYSKGEHFGISRTRDYTPTYSPNEPNYYSKEARLVSGQADNFINFMNQELFSFLQGNYRIDMNKKVFAGHSFGGLLANYIVVSKPEVFDFYLSGSPSLWYHNKSILKKEKEYSKTHTDLKTNLFMCIGANEEIKGKFPMVSDMFEFHNDLLSRNYKNLNIKSVSIPDEDHETVYPIFITKGILWVFGKG
jgi:predicted alpha/beta superfamily hydrolase